MKIPRHTSQNPIIKDDFSWILARICEGTEQIRICIHAPTGVIRQKIRTFQTKVRILFFILQYPRRQRDHRIPDRISADVWGLSAPSRIYHICTEARPQASADRIPYRIFLCFLFRRSKSRSHLPLASAFRTLRRTCPCCRKLHRNRSIRLPLALQEQEPVQELAVVLLPAAVSWQTDSGR